MIANLEAEKGVERKDVLNEKVLRTDHSKSLRKPTAQFAVGTFFQTS